MNVINIWVPEELCSCFEKGVEITDLQSKFELRVCLIQNRERRWEQGGDAKTFQLWWCTQENIFQGQEEAKLGRGRSKTSFPPPLVLPGAAGCLIPSLSALCRWLASPEQVPCKGSPESLEEGEM